MGDCLKVGAPAASKPRAQSRAALDLSEQLVDARMLMVDAQHNGVHGPVVRRAIPSVTAEESPRTSRPLSSAVERLSHQQAQLRPPLKRDATPSLDLPDEHDLQVMVVDLPSVEPGMTEIGGDACLSGSTRW